MSQETKTYALVAEPREITGKASHKVRRQGLIPGVVYGNKVAAQSVQLSQKEFEHVYMRAGSNSLIDLTIGEGGKPRKVFVHDVQRGAVNHNLIHVDFMVVNLNEEMTANVPIVLVGEAPAVARKQGLLIHQTEHIVVRSLPMNIPSLVEVDISSLEHVGMAVHVSDITLPENVTLVTNEEDVIVRINELPVAEVEPEVETKEPEVEAAEAETEGTEES